ncbi:serine-rich adhesin for platelets-like isoform X2 [Watersipora subatra]|uniref:serine-rich adhesin for platelets-like isoform X2 n=1 Tax=Watersipora subatra TaxID=2589382 RepID=UPI00355BF39F
MGVAELETNCNTLTNLFQGLINDMRDSVPAFEELVSKTTKLHSTLRSSIVAIAAFLEAFQKVADAATSSKGATKEIGKSLTRLCLRHRSIESKMKSYTTSLMEELAVPLQEKLEDWKKNTVQIDKEHAKDHKKVRGEIKRASSDTIRLQKKTRKGKTTYSKGDAKEKLEHAMYGVTDKYKLLEDVEKSYVRKALIEERKHFCDFVCCLRPVVDSEMSMVNEIAHLQEIVDHLSGLVAEPDTLPETSEQIITDHLNGTDYGFKTKTPPDSPTSDRHSLSSSMNSLVSAPESDGASQRSSSPSSRLQAMKLTNNHGLLSVASQDSGFTSQDALFAVTARTVNSQGSSSNAVTKRSHGSLEEEKSDSLSVYSSISQGSSNEFDTASHNSGSTHSVPTVIQSQLRQQPQLDRAHTIGGTRTLSRPTVSMDTYDGPQSTRSSGSDINCMGPPPRPQRVSSYDGSTSSNGSQGAKRSNTLSSNRSSMPPRARAKPKPVALPSVPFMDTEPIYMNTQELAAKIAARKKMEEEDNQQSVSQSVSSDNRPPTTRDEERKAQNDALADAIAELEASTAALNDCLEEPNNRQSVVSSSGYGTTTSNSSASEDIQLITHETVDTYHTNSINMQSVSSSNRISEESCPQTPESLQDEAQPEPPLQSISTPVDSTRTSVTDQRHANEVKREAEGVEVSNWAGKALMRKPTGQVKPPPPVRRSSSVTTSVNGMERVASQRASKPPVVSPKPKLQETNSRSSSSTARASESFPSPPPLHHDDEDPYAVPMPCHPMDSSLLPPPPPEFGLDHQTSTDNGALFNISELPPPIPDCPAPAYLTSQVSPAQPQYPVVSQPLKQAVPPPTAKVSQASSGCGHAPWDQQPKSPVKANSRGEAPPPTLAKKGKKLSSNFIAQLNSTLGGAEKAAPVQPVHTGNQPAKSAAIEQLKSGKSRESPPRGHLLSQIHGGIQLKKAVDVKDRSAPVL